MKYRIYIDDVGNPDLDSSENPNHQFLSLTGVIIELEYAATVLHPQMETLKQRYFHAPEYKKGINSDVCHFLFKVTHHGLLFCLFTCTMMRISLS